MDREMMAAIAALTVSCVAVLATLAFYGLIAYALLRYLGWL